MSKRELTTLAVVLLCSLLLAGVVLASGGPDPDWHVVGGGGGNVQAGDYALNNTIGQALVGTARDSGYELCSGFWCSALVEHTIYLPLILRSFS
jgi:hypothetical protein